MPRPLDSIIEYLALLALFGLFSVGGGLAAQERLDLSGNSYDFGLVQPNSTYRHQIWLTAPEDDSLRISDIRTGCGCITYFQSDSVALPGDSIGVVFLWQTRGSSGALNRSLLLQTSLNPRPLEVDWTGHCVTKFDSLASLVWEPRTADLGKVRRSGAPRSTELVLRNLSNSEVDVILVEQGPEFGLLIPQKIGPNGMATIAVSLNEVYARQRFESSFTLELSGNRATPSRVSIPVVHGDYSFRPDFTTMEE